MIDWRRKEERKPASGSARWGKSERNSEFAEENMSVNSLVSQSQLL